MAKRSYENWLVNQKYEKDPLLLENDKQYYRRKRAELLDERRERKIWSWEKLTQSLVGKAIKTKKQKDVLEAEKMLDKGMSDDWL